LPTFPAGDGSLLTVCFFCEISCRKKRSANAFAAWAGVSLDDFPHLDKWLNKLLERPGFEKGRHVPKRHTALDNKKFTDEELDKQAESSRAWVQSGMKAEAQK
jgi:glutathione S-transferase